MFELVCGIEAYLIQGTVTWSNESFVSFKCRELPHKESPMNHFLGREKLGIVLKQHVFAHFMVAGMCVTV